MAESLNHTRSLIGIISAGGNTQMETEEMQTRMQRNAGVTAQELAIILSERGGDIHVRNTAADLLTKIIYKHWKLQDGHSPINEGQRAAILDRLKAQGSTDKETATNVEVSVCNAANNILNIISTEMGEDSSGTELSPITESAEKELGEGGLLPEEANTK